LGFIFILDPTPDPHIGIGSAVFAALRLGLIAFPAIKAKMTR
jgi:hypothetical protein